MACELRAEWKEDEDVEELDVLAMEVVEADSILGGDGEPEGVHCSLTT